MEIPPLCKGNFKCKPFGKPFIIPTKFEHSSQNSHSLEIILTQYQPTGDRLILSPTPNSMALRTDSN